MALNVKMWETKDHPEPTYPPRPLATNNSSSQEEKVGDSPVDRDLVTRTIERIKKIIPKNKLLDLL